MCPASGVKLPSCHCPSFLKPLRALYAACKLRDNPVLDIAAFVRTPRNKAGAPFHTRVEAIPRPIGLTAYIADLRQSHGHDFAVACGDTVKHLRPYASCPPWRRRRAAPFQRTSHGGREKRFRRWEGQPAVQPLSGLPEGRRRICQKSCRRKQKLSAGFTACSSPRQNHRLHRFSSHQRRDTHPRWQGQVASQHGGEYSQK